MQAESLRYPLQELERLLKKYSPLMTRTTETGLEMVAKFGGVVAEVSSPVENQQGVDTF